jgi:hypothetical protein
MQVHFSLVPHRTLHTIVKAPHAVSCLWLSYQSGSLICLTDYKIILRSVCNLIITECTCSTFTCRWPLLDHLSEQNLVPLILELVRAAPAEER